MSERKIHSPDSIIINLITILFIILLSALFLLSLFPQFKIVINNYNLLLLSIIVVLVLSFRFTELQIPGFLKLSRTVEVLHQETEKLRDILLQVYSSSLSHASASSSVNLTVQRERAEELGVEKIPDEIQLEIKEIKKSDKDPSVVFLELISGIARKITLLGENKLGGVGRYRSVLLITSQLEEKAIIDSKTSSLIRDFWRIRNQVVHGEISINNTTLNDAISIGEKIMTQLMRILGPMVVMSPVRGVIDSVVLISGIYFTPNNEVSIFFDIVGNNEPLKQIRTNHLGSFSTEIKIPITTSGQHYYWLKDDFTGTTMNVRIDVIDESE